jgi:hypothetical protein
MTTHGGRSHCVELRCPRRHGDQLLAILFGEEATLNQPRNRYEPARKDSKIFNEPGYTAIGKRD